MKIVRLGAGRWNVYAVCSDERTCPLLDFLQGLDEKRAAKVLSDLRTYVPHSDSSEWVRNRFSWQLRGSDGILEFRWPTKKGGTPRVYWFYDENRLIVCSHGTNKKGDTDESDVRNVESVKESFIAARKARRLNVVDLVEFITSENEERNNE